MPTTPRQRVQPSPFGVLHDAFHSPKTQAYRTAQTALWILIVVSIVFVMLEPLVNPTLSRWLGVADKVVLAAFGVEYVLRVLTFQPDALKVFRRAPLGSLRMHVTARLRFMLTPLMLFDLITVLAVFPALRGLRVLRLLRLLRTVPIFRYHHPVVGIVEAFKENRILFAGAFSMFGIIVALGAVTIFLVERRAPETPIDTMTNAVWWSIVTLTTVGYGDLTPTTELGRIVAGGVMVAGMVTLAMFAGVVSHSLMHAVLSIREEQFRMSGYFDHIIVCGYDRSTEVLLETLRHEIDVESRRVVVFAEGERPPELPHPFLWVSGDPTKESQLDKVRLTRSAAVIVAAQRAIAPSQSDANVILTTFTIRSYLARHGETGHRKRPVYIITEILDAENVNHARNAGADEVIQTRQLGFSLLAHAINYPGVADTLSNVVLAGAHNIYVGRIPEHTPGESYGEILVRLELRKRGALSMGYRDPGTREEIINPTHDSIVPEGSHLIYLARERVLELP